MPFNQDLTGLVEPTGKAWDQATAEERRAFYTEAGKQAARRKRIELMNAIGRTGEMIPRKRPRRDGANGPVMDPHGANSRTFRLLDSSGTDRGCKLFWRTNWTTILGYHAAGLAGRGGSVVRDVRLSDDGIDQVRREMETWWRRRARPVRPVVPPTPTPRPPKGPPDLGNGKGPRHIKTGDFRTILPPKRPGGGTPEPRPPKSPTKPPKPPTKPPVVIDRVKMADEAAAAFAADVLAAARAVGPNGRFGGDKVFIHRAWMSYNATHADDPISYDEFRQRLLDANRRRLLTLSRADMVEAMNPTDVRRSNTHHPAGATFHFIRI